MQVLLNEDVKKLGYRGDIVNVKNGYFRNYLQPRGLAQRATENLIKLSEKRNEKRLMKKQQILEKAEEVLKKLKDLKVKIKAKVSKKGKLYGSIAEEDVINAVKDKSNIELEKEFIKMEPIRELGEYKIKVNLGENLEENIELVVEASE
ncbi:50S ribosomal protein L9 [Candidatus Peregrinibacteria bacterium]|nr:50S ribosomal protein L9 [Candidatus Peregrinibacteria bacterium]